jgi:hypothetical protein
MRDSRNIQAFFMKAPQCKPAKLNIKIAIAKTYIRPTEAGNSM